MTTAKVVFWSASGYTYLADNGQLWTDRSRSPSGDWTLTGAVEYGRGYTAGHVVRRYSLADVLEGRVPWLYKNRKQRCFPTDLDHGHHRVWMNPPLLTVTVR